MANVKVSVPSRGDLFLIQRRHYVPDATDVSVPSRGDLFLINKEEIMEKLMEFPSPLGGTYF